MQSTSGLKRSQAVLIPYLGIDGEFKGVVPREIDGVHACDLNRLALRLGVCRVRAETCHVNRAGAGEDVFAGGLKTRHLHGSSTRPERLNLRALPGGRPHLYGRPDRLRALEGRLFDRYSETGTGRRVHEYSPWSAPGTHASAAERATTLLWRLLVNLFTSHFHGDALF